MGIPLLSPFEGELAASLGNEALAAASAPSAGIELIARKSAGHAVLASQGAIGRPKDFMPHLGSEGYFFVSAADNAANWNSFGAAGVSTSTYGTLTAATPTNTNAFTTQKRSKVVSPASANATAAFYYPMHLFRGNTPGAGGFDVRIRGGIETYQSGMRWGMGLVSAVYGASEPSAWTSSIWIGKDTTDSNLQLITVDSSGFGVHTKVDLGSGFPANTGGVDIYELRVFCLPNDSSMYWSVERVNTGDFAQGVATATLPGPTANLGLAWYANTNAGTSAVAVSFIGATAMYGGTA